MKMTKHPQDSSASAGLVCCHSPNRCEVTDQSEDIRELTSGAVAVEAVAEHQVRDNELSADPSDADATEDHPGTSTGTQSVCCEEGVPAPPGMRTHKSFPSKLPDSKSKKSKVLQGRQKKGEADKSLGESFVELGTTNKRSKPPTDDAGVDPDCSILTQSSCVSASEGPSALYFDEDIQNKNFMTVPRDAGIQPSTRSELYYPDCPECCRTSFHDTASSWLQEKCPPSSSSCRHTDTHSSKHEGVLMAPDSIINNGQTGNKVFLTEAVDEAEMEYLSPYSASRCSDPPSGFRSSWVSGEQAGEDMAGPACWDYNYWRLSRCDSRCSGSTMYANTSDIGAPEPTYENVFECSLRESSSDRAAWLTPSPADSHMSWMEEPIYATVGGQDDDDDEAITTFMLDEMDRDDSLPRNPNVSHVFPETEQQLKDDISGSADLRFEGGISSSSSTRTLCPDDTCLTTESQNTTSEGSEETGDRMTTTDISGNSKTLGDSSQTLPPKLPPKNIHKKPTGLKLFIPAVIGSASEDYGLQIRLPLLRDASFRNSCSDDPVVPTSSSCLPGDEAPLSCPAGFLPGDPAAVAMDENGCESGALYVVIGSASAGTWKVLLYFFFIITIM